MNTNLVSGEGVLPASTTVNVEGLRPVAFLDKMIVLIGARNVELRSGSLRALLRRALNCYTEGVVVAYSTSAVYTPLYRKHV